MKHILARLAENEFWILAFKLLKNINVIQTVQSCFSEFDASTVLLFTEIYLANRQAIKAFKLLKQTNIIYPDRNKWKPRNNAKDDYIRARIVALLLDAFCKFSLEYAFFLFEFLVINQSSNFYPVDLSRPANKIVSMTLLKKDHEMIVDVTKLIDNYSIILNTVTYRALITALVNIDIALAKQMYYNAIGLGIYSDVKFYPVTCIIVNSDWTKEEMYLSILNLMQQLSSNIGHAMDRVNAKQLPVHIVFQNVPSEKQLSCNEGKNQQCIEKINESKILMKSVLRKKFSPPISMLKRNKSIFKLTVSKYVILD
ncbi:uncharacterized protein LOC143177284 [Calliopsis andreniformis]|uniref:uncharacterized protein LOC143177284 n=1 Tax=Calliopsis andreniformis TaxID=337506 RepID=UPI003FCC8B1E